MHLLVIAMPNSGSRPGKAGLFLPLGLSYITASLKSHGHTYDCLDLHTRQVLRRNPLDLFEELKAFDLASYDAVAFGGVFLKFRDLSYLSKKIRAKNPSLFQIAGGNMATLLANQILGETEVDCVCLHEGEETIIELLNALQEGRGLRKTKSIKYLDDEGRVKASPLREKLRPERIPLLPDRESWNFIQIRKAFPFGSPGRYSAVAFASRGCPFKCTFCNPLSGREIRTRDVDSIIREIKYLKEKWNVQYIRFFDEIFIGSKKKIRSLCERMIAEKLSIFWWCQTQVRLVDEDLLKLMRKAGCIEIAFGIESGSNIILEEMRKGFTTDIARQAIEMADRAGIRVSVSIIAGTPSETVETLQETRDFAISLNHIKWTVIPTINFIVPLPNTALFDMAVESKLIDDPEYYVITAVSEMEKYSRSVNMTRMTAEEFSDTVARFNREIRQDYYYRHPFLFVLSWVGLDHLRLDLLLKYFSLRQVVPLLEALTWAIVGKRMHGCRTWVERLFPKKADTLPVAPGGLSALSKSSERET